MPNYTNRYDIMYPEGVDRQGAGDRYLNFLADGIDKSFTMTPPFGVNGRRAFNLATYSESVSNGTGYMVIQTNIGDTSTLMTQLHIQGLVYEPDNACLDILVQFYPFTDGTIHRYNVTNRGSLHLKNFKILSRNGKVAVAFQTDNQTGSFFNYPKIVVDGIFGNGTSTDATFLEGWEIKREANLNAYTLKRDVFSPRPSGEDTGWFNLPFHGGYSQYSPGNGWDLQCRRKGGVVYIAGLVKPPVSGSASIITELPPGFRPYKNTIRGAVDSGLVNRILYVNATGIVQVPGGGMDSYSYLCLDNITFPVE